MNTDEKFVYDIRKDLFENFLLALVKKHGLDVDADVLAGRADWLVTEVVQAHAKYDADFNEGK